MSSEALVSYVSTVGCIRASECRARRLLRLTARRGAAGDSVACSCGQFLGSRIVLLKLQCIYMLVRACSHNIHVQLQHLVWKVSYGPGLINISCTYRTGPAKLT